MEVNRKKTYLVPVIWQGHGMASVEASSRLEAIILVQQNLYNDIHFEERDNVTVTGEPPEVVDREEVEDEDE